jgi:hypothetical protein
VVEKCVVDFWAVIAFKKFIFLLFNKTGNII